MRANDRIFPDFHIGHDDRTKPDKYIISNFNIISFTLNSGAYLAVVVDLIVRVNNIYDGYIAGD